MDDPAFRVLRCIEAAIKVSRMHITVNGHGPRWAAGVIGHFEEIRQMSANLVDFSHPEFIVDAFLEALSSQYFGVAEHAATLQAYLSTCETIKVRDFVCHGFTKMLAREEAPTAEVARALHLALPGLRGTIKDKVLDHSLECFAMIVLAYCELPAQGDIELGTALADEGPFVSLLRLQAVHGSRILAGAVARKAVWAKHSNLADEANKHLAALEAVMKPDALATFDAVDDAVDVLAAVHKWWSEAAAEDFASSTAWTSMSEKFLARPCHSSRSENAVWVCPASCVVAGCPLFDSSETSLPLPSTQTRPPPVVHAAPHYSQPPLPVPPGCQRSRTPRQIEHGLSVCFHRANRGLKQFWSICGRDSNQAISSAATEKTARLVVTGVCAIVVMIVDRDAELAAVQAKTVALEAHIKSCLSPFGILLTTDAAIKEAGSWLAALPALDKMASGDTSSSAAAVVQPLSAAVLLQCCKDDGIEQSFRRINGSVVRPAAHAATLEMVAPMLKTLSADLKESFM
jgi:hypothetical protein